MSSVSLQVVLKSLSCSLHGCDAVLLVSASWHLFVPKSHVDQESSFLVLLTLANEPLASHWVISRKTEGKGKGVPRQAEVALGVLDRLRPWIISTFDTTRMVGRQPYAPAAFTPGEIPGTHFQRLSRP
jgi:hypothetical protein